MCYVGASGLQNFLKVLRISLESKVEMEIMIELSQEELDLIAGGQKASASFTLMQSAAGPTSATVSSTVTQTVSYSLAGGAVASQSGTAMSSSS